MAGTRARRGAGSEPGRAELSREVDDLRRRLQALEAERAFHADDDRFRVFAETMPQLVWSSRPDGVVDYFNSRWSDYTGHSTADSGRGDWGPVVHAQDAPSAQQRWSESIANGTLYEVRYRLRGRDGVYRWFLVRAMPQRGAGGAILRWFGTCTDIDRVVRAEAELAEALARETQARQDAERAVHFAELFMGVLGHDLRNPLSAILMGADSMLRTAEDMRQVKAIARLIRSGERMNRMIAQLLDLTRLRIGGGLGIERQRGTDAGELWQGVIEEMVTAHPDADLRLAQEGDVQGHWDPDRLLQVFSNLAANAIAHGTPGVEIQVRLTGARSDRVVTSIHNAGEIPPELQAGVFDPFRATTTRRRVRTRAGLGLGLYISEQIVQAHGGTIAFRSESGHGTTFTVELPR